MALLVINYGRSVDYAAMLPELAAQTYVFTHNELPGPDRYAHYEHIEDCENVPLAEVRGYQLASRVRFDQILTDNEYDLVRVGRMRERLGIAGQTEQGARAFRDKVLMKELAGKAVPVPAFARLYSVADLLDFLGEHPYPVVVKPVEQGGSRDITVVRCADDLTAFARRRWRPDLMVEQFVDGRIYHVDAVIGPGFRFVASSVYYNSCLAVFSGRNLGSVQLHPDEPLSGRLADFLDEVLTALPSPQTCAYHLEVFHTPDDELVLCEIAARLGGARIPKLIEHSYGFDAREAWFRLACGLPLRRRPAGPVDRVHADIAMTPQPGVLRTVPERPPFDWVVDYVTTMQPGAAAAGPSSSVSNVCYAVVSGATSAELQDRVERCERWLADRIAYET